MSLLVNQCTVMAIDIWPSTLVRIFYHPETDTICLAKRDRAGWWKYFIEYDDFVHMDHGPYSEGHVELIGTFHTDVGKTLTGASL